MMPPSAEICVGFNSELLLIRPALLLPKMNLLVPGQSPASGHRIK
jgi:hypothetical protein